MTMDSTNFLNVSILLFLLFTHQVNGQSPGFAGVSPAVGLCSVALVLSGYVCEELEVTTGDGYILSIAKISAAQSGGGSTNRTPVFLQHGLLVDGMTWLLNSREQNLPTILVDNGFDVFISNNRGTRFSQRHVSMLISNPEYWNWSWDDLVEKDMQSMIGFVFQKTGQKVHYIGHSMGTLVALASFAQGKLVDMLTSAVLLSPIAYLSHLNGPLSGINPQGVPGSSYPAFTGANCCVSPYAYGLFVAVSGKVMKYDYGFGNIAYYGQPTPPIYDLTKIPHDFPLFLSYGGQDTLSVVADVQILVRDLQGHDQDKLKLQLVQEYAHGDFIMAYNAKDIIYNQVLEFFKQFP